VVRDLAEGRIHDCGSGGHEGGEKIISLTLQNVQVPFGAEVVRVNPSRVRFSLERTISKLVPVVPTIQGQPAEGYELARC